MAPVNLLVVAVLYTLSMQGRLRETALKMTTIELHQLSIQLNLIWKMKEEQSLAMIDIVENEVPVG